MFKLDLEKAEAPEIKLLTAFGSQRKQENSRKTTTSDSLTMLKTLTVWITTNRKILQKIGIPDHLTRLLRNLYAGQDATVRTRHGTTDWFKIGKGVWQGCIVTLNFYKEWSQSESEVAQLCPTLCNPTDWPTRLLCPWGFPGKNTGVGCHFLMPGWMNHKLQLRLLGEISPSNTQMTPP